MLFPPKQHKTKTDIPSLFELSFPLCPFPYTFHRHKERSKISQIHLRKCILLISTVLFLVLYNPVHVFAGEAILSWNANSEPDLAGYKVYYGTSSQDYGIPIDVGNFTSHTLTGLTKGTTYYFAITAYDTSSNESDFSVELSKSIEPLNPGEPSSDSGGGGCGIVFPRTGDPPDPGDAADMITTTGVILLILFKKALKTARMETVVN